MISEERLDRYLQRLASQSPTPGGGAAAAVSAAQAAALVGMVANFTTGEKYAVHADNVQRVLSAVDELIPTALRLADEDEQAFESVIAAYARPRNGTGEKEARTAAIQEALVQATVPPWNLVIVAQQIVELGQELAGYANRNVLSDIAAAAEAARAAAATGRVNLEVNLAGIKDPAYVERLQAKISAAGETVDACGNLSAHVRKLMTQ